MTLEYVSARQNRYRVDYRQYSGCYGFVAYCLDGRYFLECQAIGYTDSPKTLNAAIIEAQAAIESEETLIYA